MRDRERESDTKRWRERQIRRETDTAAERVGCCNAHAGVRSAASQVHKYTLKYQWTHMYTREVSDVCNL